jgi:hypothetical protein
MEGSFATARDRLNQKVEENLEDASLLSALGLIDAALGRKERRLPKHDTPLKCFQFQRMRGRAPPSFVTWRQSIP